MSERTPVAELRDLLLKRGEHGWRRLAQTLQELWLDPRELEEEPSRILFARLTAAAIPKSALTVRSVLETPIRGESHSELQFSLFVAFSDLPDILSPTELMFVREQVEGFLENVEADPAQAAWMGGDLLGDHWPIEEALSALLRLARTAKFAAGREAAVHGLSHALSRASKAQQWEIVGVLKEIAESDEVASIRSYADSVVGQLRGI